MKIRRFGRGRQSTADGWPTPPDSNAEALSAAALALDVRIVEAEGLVQTVFDEVDGGPVDEREARGIDEHLHAAILEHHVVGPRLVGVVHDVRESGAARLADRESQSEP